MKIKEAREAPDGFASPVILDLAEEVFPGKTAFPLNITNTRALVELLGDDYDQWAGATVTLAKVAVNNPQTGQSTWGLRVIDAKPSKSSKFPAKPARPAKKTKVEETDDEVPF